MPDFTAAHVQATRAKNDLFAAMQGANGTEYHQLSLNYVTATRAEAEARAREIAGLTKPKTDYAEVTLQSATAGLKSELDDIEAATETISTITGAVNAILGALLLFAII